MSFNHSRVSILLMEQSCSSSNTLYMIKIMNIKLKVVILYTFQRLCFVLQTAICTNIHDDITLTCRQNICICIFYLSQGLCKHYILHVLIRIYIERGKQSVLYHLSDLRTYTQNVEVCLPCLSFVIPFRIYISK